MKTPSIQTQILGHPLIGFPVALASLGGLYLATQLGGGGILVGVISAGMLVSSARASQQMQAYRAWKLEWDAMGAAPSPRARSGWGIGVLAVMLVGVVWGLAVMVDPDGMGKLLSVIAALCPLGIAVLGLALLARWLLRRRRRDRGAVPVAVIARPIHPIPSVSAAYAALPEYCRVLFSDPSAQF